MSKEDFCKAFSFLYPTMEAKAREKRLVEIHGDAIKSDLEKPKTEPKVELKGESKVE